MKQTLALERGAKKTKESQTIEKHVRKFIGDFN